MHPLPRYALILPALLLGLTACGTSDAADPAQPTRETLANGAVAIRYPALPPQSGTPLHHSVSVGVMDGDPHKIFGDIRSLEADSAGTVYVLDHQSSEIRAFDASGNYLRTLTRKGSGPGELMAANGIQMTDRGTLWVQDHGQWQLIELSLQGEEIQRLKMPVLAYGYIWDGLFDRAGRFWNTVSHSDEPQVHSPESGLQEGTVRSYLRSYDPRTNQADSISLGDRRYRSHVSHNSQGGYTVRSVPFESFASIIVDPDGGMWMSDREEYRIVRRNEQGDTVLVVEVDMPPEPVTADDRRAYVESFLEREPEERRLAEELVSYAYSHKPLIDQLFLDDERNLWVRRRLDEGKTPEYTIFRPDGSLAGSVRLAFRPSFVPPRVRDGRLYAIVADDFGVQQWVRVDLGG